MEYEWTLCGAQHAAAAGCCMLRQTACAGSLTAGVPLPCPTPAPALPLAFSCETKTKDNVFVDVVVSVQYQVVRESLYDAFYKVRMPVTR